MCDEFGTVGERFAHGKCRYISLAMTDMKEVMEGRRPFGIAKAISEETIEEEKREVRKEKKHRCLGGRPTRTRQ